MTTAIIQARMNSARLPGKVLLPLSHMPVLWHIVERVRHAKGVDQVLVATSTDSSDDAIGQFCMENNILCFRGSLDDVLSRYTQAAQKYFADTIVRITGDCPLIDPEVIDQCVTAFKKTNVDYVSNVVPGERTYPRGLDVEVFSKGALMLAHAEAKESFDREHVTPYICQNKNGNFTVGKMIEATGIYERPQYRLTLDHSEDYALMQRLYDLWYKKDTIISIKDVIEYLDTHPDVAHMNAFREHEQINLPRV